METFLTGLAAFVGGALVSWVNYLLLCRLMNGRGDGGIGLSSPLRMILNAAYLLILLFISKRTGLSLVALLVGGALGLTAGLTFFTLRLTSGLKGKRKE